MTSKTKRALVLAGGGTRGIYQLGALRALQEIGADHFDLVIGVSVGALNAAMVVQGDIDRLEEMYDNLDASQIVNGYVPNDMRLKTLFSERDEVVPQLQYYLKEGGIDIRPFYDFVDTYYNEEKLLSSKIDFGCVTARKKDHSGVYVNREMMKEHGKDWLVASASAYPAFPVKVIADVEYIDGGYFDNCPIDYALQQGCTDIIAIDLRSVPLHPLYTNMPYVKYIHPQRDLYNFLKFDQEEMQDAKVLGYNDTMKVMGKYVGLRYTFHPFPLPHFTDDFIRALWILETRIKLTNNINERFRSDQYITDALKKEANLNELNVRTYIYSFLDHLMELLGLDETKVWDIEAVYDIILTQFHQAKDENYLYKPSFIPTELASYFTSFDKKSMITQLLHGLLYEEHRFFSESIVLTVAPLEAGMALFLSYFFKEEE